MDERLKQKIIGSTSYEWIKQFDVNEYVYNTPMIEKLYEEKQIAVTENFNLRERVSELENQLHQLELTKQRLEIAVTDSRKKSILLFVLGLISTILLGIGINIATSSTNVWVGWMMIIIAITIEAIAFFLLAKG